ncbi:hypothetical protein LOZ58_001643 [Ophidiomyces ophidiicola]|nr:hypothetical protein LOZ58_001643 [Ophidiomyces ophidiicola]
MHRCLDGLAMSPPSASIENTMAGIAVSDVVENGGFTPPNPSPSNSDVVVDLGVLPDSPSKLFPKNVAFELLLDEESKMKARIPMRVQIFPHDTTDSIVTTVKNFYGIYDGRGSGVSFEDETGTTLIARYENLRNNMTVYVRVIRSHDYPTAHQPFGQQPLLDSEPRPCLGEPFQPSADQGRSSSRAASRASLKRSASPAGRGRRSASTQKASRAGNKSRGSSTHGSFHDDNLVPYSDSDGGHTSITSSKKGRVDHFASSEISMENILHDGRRKRPKFESSELPLFAPPQVPITTSASSISPQRRSTLQDGASPFARPMHPFDAQLSLHSPHGVRNHEQLNALQYSGNSPCVAPQNGHRLRERANSYSVHVHRNNDGILPTPDPTIASCISDEDVAMQLIRLGDATNFSHGRPSLSTADDAFSGVADASSTGQTTDGEMSADDESRNAAELEYSSRGSGDDNGAHHADEFVEKHEVERDAFYDTQTARTKRSKFKSSSGMAPKTKQGTISRSAKVTKARPGMVPRKTKAIVANGIGAAPLVSAANHQHARKLSTSGLNFQHELAADEEDLSTKPRCQRCRKSKKGCDRQRPCQRCRDAGIGIEGCISEDEGNGRKGRYGRHMGVPIKKAVESMPAPLRFQTADTAAATFQVPASQGINKKRKR